MSFLRISEILECKHITSIIACLYMRGSMSKSSIYANVSTNPRMGQKIDMLIESGLLESKHVGRRINISLTEKGNTIGQALCRMEEELYGDYGDEGHIHQGDYHPGEYYEDCCDEWFAQIERKHGRSCEGDS